MNHQHLLSLFHHVQTTNLLVPFEEQCYISWSNKAPYVGLLAMWRTVMWSPWVSLAILTTICFDKCFSNSQLEIWASFFADECSLHEEHEFHYVVTTGCIGNSDYNMFWQVLLQLTIGDMGILFCRWFSLHNRTEHFGWLPSKVSVVILPWWLVLRVILVAFPIDFLRK